MTAPAIQRIGHSKSTAKYNADWLLQAVAPNRASAGYFNNITLPDTMS
jgi:hypothetical protein